MNVKTALQQMISVGKLERMLYKYREDCENTERIFTEHTLWFAHPNEFNDPYDCYANVQLLDKEGLQKLIKKESYSSFEEQIYQKGLHMYDIDKLRKNVSIVLNEIGVCCFTKNASNVLMWSHYAKYHRGLCLEFDILEDPSFFTFPLPVTYVDKMPEYDHFKEPKKLVEKIIQPKYETWKYEEEVRVIKTSSDIQINNNTQAFKFNPKALKRVIFGCKSTEEMIEKYKSLCKDSDLEHVIFTKMFQKNDGSFELEERSLD